MFTFQTQRNFAVSVPFESGSLSCNLCVDRKGESHAHEIMRVYAPYWLVNKTGLDLQFKQARILVIFFAD
jgi:hypothetical protein